MPRHLKLIARFVNSGLAVVCFLMVILSIPQGKIGAAILALAFGALFAFNLYLIEKAASILSEEEWLKGEVRKVLLRRKLKRMAKEDAAETAVSDMEQVH